MFYGWVVLFVLCYAHYILQCGFLYTYGPTLSAMVVDFGSTMTAASVAKTCYSLACALLALAVGWVIAQYSAKLCLLIGAVAGALGSILMIFCIDSMPAYLVCSALLLATMTTFGSGIAAHTIISRWFYRRRGLALGILMSSGGVGGFTIPGLTTYLIERTGSWRAIWVFVLFGCISSFFLSLFLLKNRPEEMGAYPDGLSPQELAAESGQRRGAGVQRTKESWGYEEAVRSKMFRTIVLARMGTAFAMNSITAYTVATFVDKGLTLGEASMALSIFSFVNFFTRLLSGPVMDRYEPKYIYGGCMIAMAATCMLMPVISSAKLAYCFGALFGFSFGFTVIGPQTLLLNAFGAENFSRISAVQMMIDAISVSVLSLLPGIIRDQTGSFDMLYMVLAASLVLGAAAIIRARPTVRSVEEVAEQGRHS